MSLVTPTEPVPLERLGRVHFVGIGGAGMSGIARIMLARGFRCPAATPPRPPRSTELGALGARVHVGHDAANVGGADTSSCPARSARTTPRWSRPARRGLRVLHRAGALASLMVGRRVVAVAGTHGKTTTTSMLTTVLQRPARTLVRDRRRARRHRRRRGRRRGRRLRRRGRRERRLVPHAAPRTSRSSPTSSPTTWTTTGPSRRTGVVRRLRRPDQARRPARRLRRRPGRARAGRPAPAARGCGCAPTGVGGRRPG